MAAECPLAERRIVEIKMGRSKFPGKPSKIGNRKRVNLSSCALPEENESSKAAENIYLGLSMFNETFGDNEMATPIPFHGFSAEDIEDALAEARLQQRESEMEYKKQGLNINSPNTLQSELASIVGCFSLNGNHDKNKTRLCFDGGGGYEANNHVQLVQISDTKPSINVKVTSNLHGNQNKVRDFSNRNNIVCKKRSQCEKLRTVDSKRNIFKLPKKLNSFKSLQSRAAKKLLQKAKMSNVSEMIKNNASERKFVLPSYSMRSLRVIKPNKRFLENDDNRKSRLLRARNMNINSSLSSKKESKEPKLSADIAFNKELRVEISDDLEKKSLNDMCAVGRKFNGKKESNDKLKINCTLDSSKANVHYTSTGKLILREPKLQLNRISLGLTEGPFSSSSRSSSLSPNSQLNPNPVQMSMNRTVTCGICGSVKFYKFVELSKKFGIYCCEPCQKFISKVMKLVESHANHKLQCSKGKGLCLVPALMKSLHSAGGSLECQACWLKLCLKNLKMSTKLKTKLTSLLPVDMQLSSHSDPLLDTSYEDINSSWHINSNSLRGFRWSKQMERSLTNGKIAVKSRVKDKDIENKEVNLMASAVESSLKKVTGSTRLENKRKLLRHRGRVKAVADDGNRQRIDLKGPRVKNVCRSASVVLGQPLATFPRESSPKKQTTDSGTVAVKNCDKLETTNGSCNESQEVILVDKNKDAVIDKKQLGTDKKSNVGSKQTTCVKPSPAQQNGVGKTKRKANSKTENPISIDFWETYDPEEVCETGFGLIGSENFSVRALCFLCGSAGQEKLIHCASCCEPYHEFCVNEEQVKRQDEIWKYDWVCPRCTVCITCGKTSGQQLKCVKCDNSYHTECVDRVGGRLLHSPDRPWVCSVCLRCKSCNGVDVSVFVGNLPLCRACFVLRQKGNYCPLCQRCYEDDDYDSKMMECGMCKCWVHAKCEGLSDEKYQVLSFLPESVEYICRMCCVMPPAPWWIAVEAELKSGYLGVLKALSKNRKACAMLKWSPRKQCTCRQVNFTPRALDFDDLKLSKSTDDSKGENSQTPDQESVSDDKKKEENCKPAAVLERKTSIEVINHDTDSLKLTLKIMKGTDGVENGDGESETEKLGKIKEMHDRFSIKECSVRIKKCSSNDDAESLGNTVDCGDDSQQSPFKNSGFNTSGAELPDKRSLSSPFIPSSDSGIGSTDDELKASSLTDEESCRPDDQQSNRVISSKTVCEPSVPYLEEKNECICFLEVDTYNSRSKPFSPNLLSIKKKVTTSEYSSLQQFHMDMQRMIATTQSTELMEMYHQTVKEIFPWFDPKFSRVYSNSQKISGTTSVESTPAKGTPTKSISYEDCKIPNDKLTGQPLEYYYSGHSPEDDRSCLMCKEVGDGLPHNTGRLLYCGQNEWVHCNCALWSAEVFEEIDGSLQNVHSAINRGRLIRCPECKMKGASIGCCARNCAETFHFNCARKIGCAFMDDKTVYCPAHLNETKGKVVQKEKEFEIRRPVYVELDKKKMKMVDSDQVRFAAGGLHVNSLGRFVVKFSDYPDAIVPDLFQCTRLFWSCYEPWRIVKYHFTVRLQEDEEDEGVDFGINLTVDHSKPPELLGFKLQQLKYFQEHHKLLEIDDESLGDKNKEKRKLVDKLDNENKTKSEDLKIIPAKRSKKDNKIVKKIVDLFDPREDESCLSDSQNTADLLPPELEEAIFKDLPNDILDGISMQDIFMDIKTDLYENGEKEIRDGDEALEPEEIVSEQPKMKRTESAGESNNEAWPVAEDTKQTMYEWTEETSTRSTRDLKRSRSDVFPTRRNITLKTNQRSCSLNWNCKMDIHTAKWKRNSKTVNLLEPQERGNMLQELKFTDGLVVVSTESLGNVKDLKDRLSIQQEEGKENKCLPWHMRLQPRLLQVDGGIDSSSSGSEAGESPQRLMEENVINTRGIPPPQSSPFSPNAKYSDVQFASSSQAYHQSSFNLPQIDGVDDGSSDESDFEYFKPMRTTQCRSKDNFKITQLDGSADSESEERANQLERISPPLCDSTVKDEPVKCNQCRCTYRTKISYERHLENCCNDYILFSSDGEGSEEESSLHHANSEEEAPKEIEPKPETQAEKSEVVPQVSVEQVQAMSEAKKIKKPQVRRKPAESMKKPSVIANSQNVQQILVQQSGMPSAVIVQDVPQANMVPSAFIDPGAAIQYVTSLDSSGAFAKPQLIATPSALMPGSFHIQTPESQLIPSLPVLSHSNLPGIVIQQPQVTGTLISPQPTPVVMSGDQMMLGAAPLLEVIHDPQTGGMFLASHNQPVFYNMETIVSNTVMQTNQYVSNVMTASSFSQTSTQVVQTSKLEQVMNVPSNFILLGQSSADKIISSSDLICLSASQPLIQNPSPVQAVVNPIIQTSQTFNAEPKIIQAPINSTIRCIQPFQAKRLCSPTLVNKAPSTQPMNRTPEVRPRVTITHYNKNAAQSRQSTANSFKSMPMMRPNVTKSPPRQYEKAVIVPKSQKVGSRVIVDYINNFKSENCEVYPSPKRPVKVEEIQKREEVVEKKQNDEIKKSEVETEAPIVVVEPPITPVVETSESQLSVEEKPKADESITEAEALPPSSPAKEETPDLESSEPTDSMDVDGKVEPEVREEPSSTIEETVIQNLLKEESIKEEEPNKSNDVEEAEEEMKETKENSPAIENQIPEVLPLQETSPSVINTPNVMPKTTPEKLQEKSQFGSDQNCIATKLVTIHPRLIQSPGAEFETENKMKVWLNGKSEDKGPKLIFDVTSDDGFRSSSTSMAELWAKICDSVQEMRSVFKIPTLPISRKGHEILGMQNHGLQHCLEQLRGVEQCVKYKCKYFIKEKSQKLDDRLAPVKENLSGCARTESFSDRKDYDMFAWLASRHRRLPKLCETSEEILSSARRANSLPMAMRYRHLRETSKTYVGVYRSKIHGKGLFCLREIEAGEMVIEYAGEVIRSNITDKREKYYTEKGIGCYMFRIDDHFVVDATMKGNAARFINHSCEPNCYSRVVDILGKKHIVIFALRRIRVMEELTYDYKFPFEDEKISCHCLSKKCRKYLN